MRLAEAGAQAYRGLPAWIMTNLNLIGQSGQSGQVEG
jgi:hypothetical protein